MSDEKQFQPDPNDPQFKAGYQRGMIAGRTWALDSMADHIEQDRRLVERSKERTGG